MTYRRSLDSFLSDLDTTTSSVDELGSRSQVVPTMYHRIAPPWPPTKHLSPSHFRASRSHPRVQAIRTMNSFIGSAFKDDMDPRKCRPRYHLSYHHFQVVSVLSRQGRARAETINLSNYSPCSNCYTPDDDTITTTRNIIPHSRMFQHRQRGYYNSKYLSSSARASYSGYISGPGLFESGWLVLS